MNKILKYFLVLVVVIAGLFVLTKMFGISFPMRPASAFEWEKTVLVYFGNKKMGSSEDCQKVFPLSRKILNAETFGPGATEALLEGVSEEEKNLGYFTSLNEGILLRKFEVINRVAYVDFDARFNEGMGGSCRVASIRAQIDETLNNLPDIDSVVISVNGQTEGILEP